MLTPLVSTPYRQQVWPSLIKHEVRCTGGKALVHCAISISVDVGYVIVPQSQRENIKAGSSIGGNQINDRYS